MKDKWKSHRVLHRFLAALSFVTIMVLVTPLCTWAQEEQTPVIKVGAFPYDDQLQIDAKGNYSGYGYDYLQEIARYTGWRYEFVDASWDESLTMLEKGEIDLIGAVLYSPERDEQFDFSKSSMISGYGVLATTLENDTLPYEDFQGFDGLQVGVIKGNLQGDSFLAYSRKHGFTPVMHEYNEQAEMDAALASGDIDAIVLTNILRSSTLRVVASFGENDAYFATTKGNKKILTALNDAMREIRLHDPYFNSILDQKYYNLQASTAISFTQEELDFIKKNPPIPCTHIPEAAPLNYYEKSTGTVQGLTIDVCELLEERTGLTFQWLAPKSATEAAEMLSSGEALLLPAKYYDPTWAKQNNAHLTSPYLQGQMVMIKGNRSGSPTVIATYDGNAHSQLAAEVISGETKIEEYATIIDCVEAVLHGDASVAFINSTIASHLMNNPKYSGLQTTSLYGFSADVAMAVSNHANPLLLSILNKGLRSISSTEMNQFLLLEMKREQAGPLVTYLYQYPIKVILIVIGIFALLSITLLIVLRKMRRTLYTDPLTGYPNFRALSRDTAVLVNGHPEDFALIYLDIRRFKVINDTFGYGAGDRVLIATSHALHRFIEHGERMARVHADTFVLLLRYTDHDLLQARINTLSDELEQLSFENAEGIKPLFRGGIYLLPKDFSNLERGCDRANYAKGSISHLYSNTFVFYDDLIHNQVLAEKELENSMSTALAQEEFIPYYQPKVNAITEKVVGAEALVRWLHPEKGCLSPMEFIPFYEQNGFIVKIDLSVFEQVCRNLQQWIQKGQPVVPISINFSRRNIENKELPRKLKEIAESYQVPMHLLEIEVTETEELEDLDNAVDFVESLKAYGFRVSIDDYGTGYSSISFLQQLPFDVLKLDRKFILNAMKTDKARDIMQYLVSAMRKNGIHILCEGIENKEQRDFVIGLDCRFIQGFLYSTPLSKEQFENYLSRYGIDTSNDLDCLSIVNFDKNKLIGIEDFLAKTMPSWIFSCLVAPGYPILYISPNLLSGLGYGELEFRVATNGLYVNAIHPQDLPVAFALLEKRKNSKKDLTLQYRIRKKDGSYLWIREVNKRILTEDGKEALLGICTNITDIVTLEMEKNRLIETIPGGVGELLLTPNGPIIQQASDLFYEVLGHTKDEMAELGNNIYHILCKENLSAAKEKLCEILEKNQTSCQFTFRIRHQNGSRHWITFRGTISNTLPQRSATVIIHNSDEEIQTQQMAKINQAKLELALSLTAQSVFEYDIQAQTFFFNNGFSAYSLQDKATVTLKEILNSKFIHPEDISKISEVNEKILSGKTPSCCEIRMRNQKTESSYDWLRITLSIVAEENGLPTQAIVVVENINQQKSFEYAFQYEQQYRKIFADSSLMAYEFNLTKDIIQRIGGSRGFRLEKLCQSLEHPNRYSEVLAAAVHMLVASEDQEQFLKEISLKNLMNLYQSGIYEKELEYRRLTPEGQEWWNSVLIHLFLDQLSGDVIGYAYHRSIHERKMMEKNLANQAACDPLTGVFNRTMAEHWIGEALSQLGNSSCIHAFLVFDLDRFKAVNDTYGHLIGDKCLIKLAQILKENTKKEDIVARMGGDEFTVLLKNISDINVALTFAKNITEAATNIGKEFALDSATGVSIGIAMAPQHGTDFETLYRHADEAMYRAKQQPGSRVILYEEME